MNPSIKFLAQKVAVGCLALVLAACSSQSGAPKQCQSGELLCGGACVNIATDVANCGGCGLACTAPTGGAVACSAGVCAPSCTQPSALCGARTDGGPLTLICTDASRDPVNCGQCGQVCAPQQTCNSGQCTNCPSGQLQCPSGAPGQTVCRAILSDNQNCGGCGVACASPSFCQGGACVSQGLSNCGNADGGPAQQKDLQNDPLNCGACGNACVAGEVCRVGECQPCEVAACSNRCVDTFRDSRNCGACGTVCPGTQACVAGRCAQPVLASFLPPASSGLVPATGYSQQVRVDSALPMQRVTLLLTNPDGSDGGVQLMNFDPSLNPIGVPSSSWNAFVAVPDGGTLTAEAFDIAFRPDAGDAAQHKDKRTTVPLTPLPVSIPVPVVNLLRPDGGVIGGGSFIPLNADPITISITDAGPVTSMRFFDNVSPQALLGEVPVSGGNATLTLSPAEMLSNNAGGQNVVACGVDSIGQGGGLGAPCSTTPTVTVGRMPLNGATPLVTAQSDGGSATLWFMAGTTGVDAGLGDTAQLITASATTIVNSFPSTPLVATPYITNSLRYASDTAGSVLALRGDGTALDRFDCAAGGQCNHLPYVSTSGNNKLAKIIATTTKAVLLQEQIPANAVGTGQLLFANNPAPPGGTAPAAQAPVGTPAFPINTGNMSDCLEAPCPESFGVTDSGAVVFYTQNLFAGATSYQLYIAHPAFSGTGGVAKLGNAHSQAPLALNVFPTGEIVWQFVDNALGTPVVQAAYFDGSTLKSTAISTGVTSQPLTGFRVVRPNVLLGVASKPAGQLAFPTIAFIDLTKAQPTVVFPTPPNGTTVGFQVPGVRGREHNIQNFAVSDDQLKAIYVTSDPNNDPNFQTTFTLWLLDLTQGVAGPLYSSPTLQGPLQKPDMAPQFVHTVSGAALTEGSTPGALAAVPAIVWGDGLAPSAGGLTPTTADVRLFYALYTSGSATPVPVAVDRLAASFLGWEPNVFTVPSAAGATLLFVTGTDTKFDLYSVPLAAATGTATSRLVMDSLQAFRVRENKGRLLVLRSDGKLYAGSLKAGTNPGGTLVSLGDGGLNGTVPATSQALNPLSSFDFTPDGDHAWMLAAINQGLVDIGNAGTPIGANGALRLFDLTQATPTRTNLGAEAWFGLDPTGLPPLPCFLGNAALEIGSSAYDPNVIGFYNPYFALTKQPTHLGLGLPISNSLGVCLVSLDGTEALALFLSLARNGPALVTPTPLFATVALSSSGDVSVGTLPSLNFDAIGPAVASASLGTLPEWTVLDFPRAAFNGTVVETFVKVWGQSAVNGGKPFPMTPIASGGKVTLTRQRQTDAYKSLLLSYKFPSDSTGGHAVQAPLAGTPPPKALLP